MTQVPYLGLLHGQLPRLILELVSADIGNFCITSILFIVLRFLETTPGLLEKILLVLSDAIYSFMQPNVPLLLILLRPQIKFVMNLGSANESILRFLNLEEWS